MNIESVVQEHAAKELVSAFNAIAVRHGLNARDAVVVVSTHCAHVIGRQFKKTDNADSYALASAMMMSRLIRDAMPVVTIDKSPQSQ
jgi:hypothetical protein